MQSYKPDKDEKNAAEKGESLGRELDLGQVLAVNATTEEERKVLWKLDLMCAPLMVYVSSS